MVLGLLGTQAALGNLGDQGVVTVFLQSVVLNFYAIGAVLFVLFICLTGRDFGPMRAAERRAREEGKLWRDGAQLVVDESVVAQAAKPGVVPRMRNMFLPLLALVLMVPAGIAITGMSGVRAEVEAGELVQPGFFDYLNLASGATAVLWAVLLALAVAAVLFLAQRIFTVKELTDLAFRGGGGMLPLAALMMFAFAIGMTSGELGTGAWVAETVEPVLNPKLIAPVIFLVSCFVAFSTGTSWGAMAIMVPLAAAYQVEGAAVSVPLVVSAVLGGAVFGDHCSPISDTTVVSSMAAASDHIDHVRTQMPYAVVVGLAATLIYVIVGLFA